MDRDPALLPDWARPAAELEKARGPQAMVPFPILWGWVLMATVITDASASLVEQRPRWVLVPRGQAKTLQCILRDSQYPWMSWYQQDLQGQLQLLATLRNTGDKELVSHPGADYQVTRVDNTELRLQVANVTQGRTLYCTCSKDTVRHPPWTNE
uniref:Immunoglobulin V-set domain-containing protein n=1 Tax=Lynx canadensis TaxID=61383 RepID=A0A667HQY5_LYNCA